MPCCGGRACIVGSRLYAPTYYFRYLPAALYTGRSQSTEHSVENPAQRFRPSSTINKTGSRLVNCQPDGKGSNHQSPSGNHQKFFRDTECPWAGVALKGPSREAGQHPPVRPRRAPSCTLASREVACCDPCGDSDIEAFRLPRRIQSPGGTRWCFLEYSTAKPGEKKKVAVPLGWTYCAGFHSRAPHSLDEWEFGRTVNSQRARHSAGDSLLDNVVGRGWRETCNPGSKPPITHICDPANLRA